MTDLPTIPEGKPYPNFPLLVPTEPLRIIRRDKPAFRPEFNFEAINDTVTVDLAPYVEEFNRKLGEGYQERVESVFRLTQRAAAALPEGNAHFTTDRSLTFFLADQILDALKEAADKDVDLAPVLYARLIERLTK